MALVDIYNKPNNMGNILKKFLQQKSLNQVNKKLVMAQMQAAGAPQQGGPPPGPQEILSQGITQVVDNGF